MSQDSPRPLQSNELMAVRLGPEHYAIPVEGILEVVKPETPTPVPRLPDWISGVVRRGRGIVAIFDLARLCGRDPEPEPSRLIVLAAGELEAALPVSEITGMVRVSADRISAVTAGPEPIRELCNGQFVEGDALYSVLDVERLLRHASPAASSRSE